MTEFTRSYYRFPDGELKWSVTCERGNYSFSLEMQSDGLIGKLGRINFAAPKIDHTTYAYYQDRAMNHYIPNILPLGDDAIWEQLEKDFDDAHK